MHLLASIWRRLFGAALPRPRPARVKGSFQNTPLSGLTLDGVPMHSLPAHPMPLPACLPSLTEALKRRRDRHRDLRSLWVVETTLRYAPNSGLDSIGESVLRGALGHLLTFDELSTDRHLIRLERQLRLCLAGKQAQAQLSTVRSAQHEAALPLPTTMSPGMARALAALQAGDQLALRHAGASPPSPAPKKAVPKPAKESQRMG